MITTHDIEEARQAPRVGTMIFGKLLEEESPDLLLRGPVAPNFNIYCQMLILD